MPHIHTSPEQHDSTVSAYIVRMDLAEPAILLHEHRLLHQWLQFGGHVELHEGPWQALMHEITEESGYDMHQLQLLQPKLRIAGRPAENVKRHPQPFYVLTHQFGTDPHYHTDMGFAFTTHEAPRGQVGTGESTTIQPFTREEVAALPADSIPESVRGNILFIFDSLLAARAWERVPATDGE